jgi:hypothetical protein
VSAVASGALEVFTCREETLPRPVFLADRTNVPAWRQSTPATCSHESLKPFVLNAYVSICSRQPARPSQATDELTMDGRQTASRGERRCSGVRHALVSHDCRREGRHYPKCNAVIAGSTRTCLPPRSVVEGICFSSASTATVLTCCVLWWSTPAIQL